MSLTGIPILISIPYGLAKVDQQTSNNKNYTHNQVITNMKITKHYFRFLLAGLFGVFALQAAEPVAPQKSYHFGPVTVQKPVFLDSVNLNNSSFSEEMLLSTPISFPD